MEERNNNYTIMEGCTLPSKGLIYDQKVNPNIELRSMTARDEMKRLNPSATPLKTLADIIENCCIEKPAIHVYDMAVGDYEFLLHKLRIVTYGPEYKVSVTCPYCGEGVDTSAKLDELEVKEFDAEEFEAIRTFTLPVGGQIVSLKFNTPRALDSIENRAKEMKRKAKGAEINVDTYAQMLYVIDTVDGKKLSQLDLEYFINELPARDMNAIINHSDKLNNYVGLENLLSITCPKCGEESNTFFRFGPEFFRPTND